MNIEASPEAEAKPWYYYGGPGYYQGHYLRGIPGFPGYRLIEYSRRKREAQSALFVDYGYGYGYLRYLNNMNALHFYVKSLNDLVINQIS